MSGCSCAFCKAAEEAHFAAVSELETSLGREPQLVEVASALARAFGSAMGLLAVGGCKPELVQALYGRCAAAAEEQAKETLLAAQGARLQ